MKKSYGLVVMALTLSLNSTRVHADESRSSGSCEKEAISAAKDFAADDGDEACAGKERTRITDLSAGRNSEEVYTIDVNCGEGTSFTETVVLDSSCKVINQH